MVKVEFEYNGDGWDVFVSGAADEIEAYQALNSILKACKPIKMAPHPSRIVGERRKLSPVVIIIREK